MSDPILPTASSLLTSAIDAIVSARPESLQFFNSPTSRWQDLPAMWRAQLLLLLSRLGDECSSARLVSATGDALRQLAASEFNTVLPSAPQQALGSVTLARPLGPAIAISNVTSFGASSSLVTTATPHGLSNIPGISQGVFILNVGGATNVNASWNSAGSFPGVVSPTQFTVPTVPGGAYTSGGTSQTFGLAGVIRAGTKFSKFANPTAFPLPIAAATYTSTQTVYVPAFPTNAAPTQQWTVPVLADSGGAAANVPTWVEAAHTVNGLVSPTTSLIVPASPLFDPTIFSYDSTAAGGSSGLNDPALRAACQAYAVGQYGPTDAALVAGSLSLQSVRHLALFPATSAIPYAQLVVADESWSTDGRWITQVQQYLNDNWVGFGGRVRVGSAINQWITIVPTIVLKSTDALNFTDAITANVAAAAKSYFDDRPDWYRWRQSTLQALLSVADARILQCTGVTVTDALTGAAVAEGINVFTTPAYGTIAFHMMLIDANVRPQLLPPS